MITTTSRSLLLPILLTLGACEPPVDVGTGDSSGTAAEDSTGDNAGSADSTGAADSSTGSTGADGSSTGAEDSSTGAAPLACLGDDCTVSCGPGLVCTPHPDNASRPVCAAPDLCTVEGVGSACAVDIEGCDGPVIGECRAISLWAAMCFPIL